MKIREAIQYLEQQIANPRQGLPEDIFLFISRLTPLVNVDLLVKDERGRTLLGWRVDQYAGAGWHLPGGIVRYKEKMEDRVQKVAETEMGAAVEFNPVPLAINQIVCDHDTRGHFISHLYQCFLSGKYIPKNAGLTNMDNGYLEWHDACPANLVKVHEIYRKYI